MTNKQENIDGINPNLFPAQITRHQHRKYDDKYWWRQTDKTNVMEINWTEN